MSTAPAILKVADAVIEVGSFDLLAQTDLDVIVNAANGDLRHGGGIARAIADAAGDRLQRESAEHPHIPDGQAAITTAGDLPYKAVVHTVGPRWSGGENDERELLASAHRSALRVAAANGHSSVGFPAVSCGIFRFPVALAAPIAIGAVVDELTRLPEIRLVRFCLFDPEHDRLFRAALAAHASS